MDESVSPEEHSISDVLGQVLGCVQVLREERAEGRYTAITDEGLDKLDRRLRGMECVLTRLGEQPTTVDNAQWRAIARTFLDFVRMIRKRIEKKLGPLEARANKRALEATRQAG